MTLLLWDGIRLRYPALVSEDSHGSSARLWARDAVVRSGVKCFLASMEMPACMHFYDWHMAAASCSITQTGEDLCTPGSGPGEMLHWQPWLCRHDSASRLLTVDNTDIATYILSARPFSTEPKAITECHFLCLVTFKPCLSWVTLIGLCLTYLNQDSLDLLI